jgi:hypothetical protein
MSAAAKQLFDGLKNMAEAALGVAGPALARMGTEIGAELKREGTQGSMEFASGTYAGQWFVPYGPGQYTPSQEHQQEHEHSHER